MTRLLVPGITTLMAVVSWIALAGWNRSGEPRLAMTLTERELSLPWQVSEQDDDDRGLQLRFEYQERHDPLDSRNWLTEDRLRALGFDLNVPVAAPEAELTYGRALPRIGWVVLEYGGPAWQEIERRRGVIPDDGRAGMLMESSRLVPVDAAPDLDALVARYPTGHLILRATFGVRYLRPDQRGPVVYGIIQRLHPAAVTVPHGLRDRLAGLRRAPGAPMPPRYEVTVALGRLGIPYIKDLQRRELIADPRFQGSEVPRFRGSEVPRF